MTESRYQMSLLEAARHGDPDAIDHLLQAAQPDIRRYAYLVCKAAEVDAVVQETLLSVLRRKCRRLARLLGLRAGDIHDVGEDEYLLLMPAEELRHDLGKAIQSLPELSRMILLLRDVEEMSIAGIAETLQLSRENIRDNLQRSRLMLREYLRGS